MKKLLFFPPMNEEKSMVSVMIFTAGADESCALEIGRLLAADRMIMGWMILSFMDKSWISCFRDVA